MYNPGRNVLLCFHFSFFPNLRLLDTCPAKTYENRAPCMFAQKLHCHLSKICIILLGSFIPHLWLLIKKHHTDGSEKKTQKKKHEETKKQKKKTNKRSIHRVFLREMCMGGCFSCAFANHLKFMVGYFCYTMMSVQ